MKIQMMIGVMLAVLLLMNNQVNISEEKNHLPPGLIVEAIVKYYPNASVEEAQILMKSENPVDRYESGNLEAGKKREPDASQERYIINIENF
jgi:hypothetical protein